MFMYRLMGWIGTVEVNWDTGLEPVETQRQNVYLGSSLANHLHCPNPPHLTVGEQCLKILNNIV